jgi:formylglycine-generating enzyme required for sulfatase activity/rRNA maturation endonuclease Nob1
MYCSACQVQFPGHLNFCKQCGKPLVNQPEESATLTKCCTRCGARVVAAENFCQQCGARTTTRTSDTTIGACQQCNTPWRSAWLYCRNCGLDRDHALQLGNAPAVPQQSMQTLTTEVVNLGNLKSEDSAANCPRCHAEATPYAQFCEVCGQNLTASEIEPFSIEEDAEVHQNTLEVAVPTENHLPVEEAELDPTRTTERVLALDTLIPDASVTSPEIYVTRESAPVQITELYYGDTQLDVPDTDPLEEPAKVSPPVERRPPPSIRMTVERQALTRKEIENLKLDDIDDVDNDYLDAAAAARTPSTSLGPSASQRIPWQAAIIGVCLIVFFLLIGIIAWREFSKRRNLNAASSASSPPPAASAAAIPEGMIAIPGGMLRMGREEGDPFERPTHTVAVAPFLIDRTEVTNEQYQKFVQETGHRAPSPWENGAFARNQGKLPVVNVSWQDATDYAHWAGKRLPSEAEWEFAARGTEARLYPWGSKWETGRANVRDGGSGRIVPVGSYSEGASKFGVLDLSGNVWEWTSSELTNYSDANEVLAPGKVIRGGAWDVPRDRATATYRGVVQADRTYDKTGFRCAR